MRGRKPILTTTNGRAHDTTIQSYVYSVTMPCTYTDRCPYDRGIDGCEAASVRSAASKCPSSLSPHAVRRGAITNWLASDVLEPVVSARANVSTAVLDEYYDRRSEREKMEQRRKCVHELVDRGIPVRNLTRSPAVVRDKDLFAEYSDLVTVGTSIPSLDTSLVKAIEPGVPPPMVRWEALDELQRAGVPVYISFSPAYPTMDENAL